MASFFKKWLQNNRFLSVLTWIASLYMRFVFKTTQWSFLGEEHPQQEIEQGHGFITSFWHQRLLMAVFGWIYSPDFSMIISSHKDGRLIAETVARFGIKWIAGSTSKGGAQALRGAVRQLKEAQVVGITPDGPRGPRHKVQSGVIAMAQLAKVNILPFTFSMSHCVYLKTWDHFVLPLPFGRGVFAWGKPLNVQGLPLDEGQKQLEHAMHILQAYSDAHIEHS